MAKKRHTAEQIISKLREAEVLLAKGGRDRVSETDDEFARLVWPSRNRADGWAAG